MLMSVVKRLRIRPMGVISKKREGARERRCSIAVNRDREAWRLA